jgi:hypothetical protein
MGLLKGGYRISIFSNAHLKLIRLMLEKSGGWGISAQEKALLLQAALLGFVQDLHQYLGSNPGWMREPPMRALLNV